MVMKIKKKYGIFSLSKPRKRTYDSILIAVAHDKFKNMGINEWTKFLNS